MTRIKWTLSIAVAVWFVCCNKDRLNQPALGQLQSTELANKKGVEGLLIGAYSLLDGQSGNNGSYGSTTSNWMFGSICGSEAYRGGTSDRLYSDQAGLYDLELFHADAFNAQLALKWKMVFDGVACTNTTLRIMRQATDMTTADTIEVRAEALFLRAFYHMEAKKIWNKPPFVDESISIDSNNYQVGNNYNIWPAIEADLNYAVAHLPVVQQAPGRANYYAAQAFLAKAYLFQQDYDRAYPLLQDLVYHGQTASGNPYALLDNYHDNFDPSKKNSAESVFAVQFSVNDNGGGINGDVGDYINYPANTLGYSFFQPSQYLVNHFKTDLHTGLPDLDHFNDVAVTNDEGIESGDPNFEPYTGTLDPRLDWTVGRRGIPFLDWGIHPGKNWIGDQPFFGPYNSKKFVITQSQFSQYGDNMWSPAVSANNINLIRFADVLLWYAEALIEKGQLDSAMYFVNKIRARAQNPAGFVYKYLNPDDPTRGYSDTPAAHYFIKLYANFPDADFARKAVRYERMLELGMEGHRFFDLVRWGIADSEIGAYLEQEKKLRDYLNQADFKKGTNEYFPIPYEQIVLSEGTDHIPKLIQNPGYN